MVIAAGFSDDFFKDDQDPKDDDESRAKKNKAGDESRAKNSKKTT